MSVATVIETIITTVPLLVTPTASLFDEPKTVTINVLTTIFGLPGQTITILSPPVAVGAPQTTPFLTFSTLQPLFTVTVTQSDVFVQAPGGSIWTTVFYYETGDAAAPTSTSWNEPYIPGGNVLVLPDLGSGWNSWSTGERAGLCVGVALFVLALLLLWCCCVGRKQEWVVQQRGTYWNGGYWGAGLRGGGGARWNKDRVAITCRKTQIAREGAGGGDIGNRSIIGGWQTYAQPQSTSALDASSEEFGGEHEINVGTLKPGRTNPELDIEGRL